TRPPATSMQGIRGGSIPAASIGLGSRPAMGPSSLFEVDCVRLPQDSSSDGRATGEVDIDGEGSEE
ncbi:MAG: hypothetical protein ACRDNG_09555, partial [Gaiellaceae bacterium]